MKIKSILWVLLSVIIIVTFNILAHMYQKNHHKNVKKSPTKICYDISTGACNPTYFIRAKQDTAEFILFYEEKLKLFSKEGIPKEGPIIKFEFKLLPQNTLVYLLEENKGNMIKIATYYDFGSRLGGNYNEGWVHKETLYNSPCDR